MAFKTNDNNTSFFSETILHTGVSPMQVAAICPTLAELKELKFPFDKEPIYTSDSPEGHKKVRIDVVLKNDKVKSKVAFFLEDKQRVSVKTGKYEITNDFGQSTWATSVEEAVEKPGNNGNKWFKPEGARIALVGEVALISFMKDWLNVSPEDVAKLDNMKALFSGNFKELQDYIRISKNNYIYTLSTVKEGKYQGIYSGFFVRGQFSIKTAMNKFSNHIKDQKDAGYSIKEDYSIDFKEYSGAAINPDPELSKAEDIF